jgi:hypothetical protein
MEQKLSFTNLIIIVNYTIYYRANHHFKHAILRYAVPVIICNEHMRKNQVHRQTMIGWIFFFQWTYFNLEPMGKNWKFQNFLPAVGSSLKNPRALAAPLDVTRRPLHPPPTGFLWLRAVRPLPREGRGNSDKYSPKQSLQELSRLVDMERPALRCLIEQ